MFGTRAVEARLPFTRFPTVVSVALHQGTADVDVVRVNDGPLSFDRRSEFCRRLERESIWLSDPIAPPRLVPADAGDDYLIKLAKDGGAQALVTRDHHFDGIRVLGLEIRPPRAIVPRLGG